MRATLNQFLSRRCAALLLVVFGLLCMPRTGNAQNDTLASVQLQKATEKIIFQMAGAMTPSCKTPRVVKTEIVKWPPEMWEEDQRMGVGSWKIWRERWHVDHCGAAMVYKIEYKSNHRGGIDIGVQIPGTGQPEPPPASSLNALLLEAAEMGNLRLIEKLLTEGAEVKTTNENGRTPLIAAVSYGYIKAVKLLLEHGSDVKAQEKGGATALYYAGTGSAELIRMLLAAGSDIHQERENGEGPLFQAASTGNIEAAEVFLEAGADVNARSQGQFTPLMEAGTYGWSEMMLFLMAHGADPSLRATGGTTVLHKLALGCNSPEVARVLLARGSFTKQDRTQTLLKALSRTFDDNCEALARVLLESEVDVEQRDEEGNTALILAARGGYTEIVQSLLKKGADVAVRNRLGHTALDLAANRQAANLIRKAGKKR